MSVRQPFLLSIVDSYLGFALQLVSTVVVSRLLGPGEVGVFAISAAFMALASMFRDFGIAEYMIQERDLTTERIRAVLALNILVSWAMALLLAVAAPFVSAFYREEGVRHVMWVQALNLMLIPFGAATMAWFRRELEYRPVVIVNALGNVASFTTTVVLALQGWSYMSLAWGAFAGIAASVLASVRYRPKHFPLWPALQGIGHAFQFGRFASGIYIFGQLGRNAPELIIGRVRDAATVGLFSRGNGIVEMVNRLLLKPVLNVCLPYFAKSDRESGQLVPAYAKTISLLTGAGWPFLAVLAVMAYPAIRIVYGAQWLAAVPLAQVLCAAMTAELVHTLSREVLIARGEVRRGHTLQVQLVLIQIAGIAGGVGFGVIGACWGVFAASVVGSALSQWHLHRAIGLTWRGVAAACRGSAAVAVLTALPLALFRVWCPPDEANFVAWGLGGGAAAAALWLLALRSLRHPLWGEIVAVMARRRAADAQT